MTKKKSAPQAKLEVPNNSPPPRKHPRVCLRLDRSGGANQSDAAGADINKIVAIYKKTGQAPAVGLSNPLYGDFTFPEDLHSMRELVSQQEDQFNSLPAAVRAECQNDWVQFAEKLTDPDQRPALVAAGLIIKDTQNSTETPKQHPYPSDASAKTTSNSPSPPPEELDSSPESSSPPSE